MKSKREEIPEDLMRILEDGECAGPADESMVQELERSIGFSVPSQYRTFLLTYGAALVHGLEVYGLVNLSENEPPMWSDIRNVLRLHGLQGLPGRLIPISDDGGDYRFFLMNDENTSLGGSVIVYGPGCDGLEVTSNFYDFIRAARDGGVSSLIPGR